MTGQFKDEVDRSFDRQAADKQRTQERCDGRLMGDANPGQKGTRFDDLCIPKVDGSLGASIQEALRSFQESRKSIQDNIDKINSSRNLYDINIDNAPICNGLYEQHMRRAGPSVRDRFAEDLKAASLGDIRKDVSYTTDRLRLDKDIVLERAADTKLPDVSSPLPDALDDIYDVVSRALVVQQEMNNSIANIFDKLVKEAERTTKRTWLILAISLATLLLSGAGVWGSWSSSLEMQQLVEAQQNAMARMAEQLEATRSDFAAELAAEREEQRTATEQLVRALEDAMAAAKASSRPNGGQEAQGGGD